MLLHWKGDQVYVEKEADLARYNLALASSIELRLVMKLDEFEAFSAWKAEKYPSKVERVSEPVKVERDFSY